MVGHDGAFHCNAFVNLAARLHDRAFRCLVGMRIPIHGRRRTAIHPRDSDEIRAGFEQKPSLRLGRRVIDVILRFAPLLELHEVDDDDGALDALIE